MRRALVFDGEDNIEGVLEHLRHPCAVEKIAKFHGFELELVDAPPPHEGDAFEKGQLLIREVLSVVLVPPVLNHVCFAQVVQAACHLLSQQVVETPIEYEKRD